MEPLKCDWSDLKVTPDHFNFEAEEGSPFVLPSRQLKVETVGTGTLSSRWTVSSNSVWLSVNPPYGEGQGFSLVHVDPRGMVAGTYEGALTFVSDVSISIIPSRVPVTLVVSGEPEHQSISQELSPQVGLSSRVAESPVKKQKSWWDWLWELIKLLFGK